MAETPVARLVLPLLCVLPLHLAGAQLQQKQTTNPAAAPVLVELFTSEGCSSCPPADDLLRQVNRQTTAAGQLIVGLSEHVTYWNRLGWIDPFSSDRFTARQSAYGERFHLDDVYTPQIVVNGRKQILGSDAPALLSAVKDQLNQPAVALQILSAQRNGDKLNLQYRVGALPGRESLQLMAAFTDDADASQVSRGENTGRELHHAAVARSLTELATIVSSGEQASQITLPAQDATQTARGHTLVLFLQSANFGPVLGIAVKTVP